MTTDFKAQTIEHLEEIIERIRTGDVVALSVRVDLNSEKEWRADGRVELRRLPDATYTLRLAYRPKQKPGLFDDMPPDSMFC